MEPESTNETAVIETAPAAELDPIQEGLAEQTAMAREQIGAAWQLHVERVQEPLATGWKDQIAKVVEERFTTMAGLVEQEANRRAERLLAEATERLAAETGRVRSNARREMSERLNQVGRRLDQAENVDAWVAALLDGAQAHAPRVILFSALGGKLRYEGHRGSGGYGVADTEGLEIALDAAPAFREVIDSQDAVITLRSGAELSEALASRLGAGAERRVCLLPVLSGRGESERQVAAILYAETEGEPLDVNVLELLCSLGGATYDCRRLAAKLTTAAKAGTLMAIAPAEPAGHLAGPVAAPAVSGEPDWSRMPREEQEVHLKAQRFARVRVAEMRLYLSQAVKEGRAKAKLYLALRGEIDRGRAQFKHEFMHVASMPDYFHQELVRTLAHDDESLLGAEYPGPLV
jgi:hypothetical protein